MGHDVDVVENRESAARGGERRFREIDEVDGEAPGRGRPFQSGCRGEELRQLRALARAKLDESRERRGKVEDLAGVPVEPTALPPRDLIPKQLADRFEQRRAERIVEIS